MARKKKKSTSRSVKIPVYTGKFGQKEVERLLWRAGFGPRPGDIKRYKRLGMKRAVAAIVSPKRKAQLVGPSPQLEDPLKPNDIWGHDHIWWLDRMVRSNHQLDERMTLIWHDWFATSNDGVGNQKLMVAQNEMLRQKCLGSFRGLLYNVTVDPAMLVWLSGDGSDKRAPNENYGREMMELFTLGAGARYTETDVREQARALTGFTSEWSEAEGHHNFHFEDKRHDNDPKTIFGKTGNFGWQDSCNLCIDHPDHAAFFVQKLWSYFVPVPLTGKNLKAFISLYKRKGYRVRPVVQAILMHPAFYKGPGMIKPPIVFTAGLLRAQNAGVTSDAWAWLSEQTGQRLFYPPNVAGWDDDAWLDTGRFRGRWNVARHATEEALLDPSDNKDAKNWDPDESPEQAFKNVMNFWGNPIVNAPSRAVLMDFARKSGKQADSARWKKKPYRVMRQNAMRTLLAMSPDQQTS
ncbi:MAG: DUF1800 domain-containing protein [Thermoleophilaceae bacterium]|nr:DUF1800 domain-containing protein [Thermoleophilaceae bacterium]